MTAHTPKIPPDVNHIRLHYCIKLHMKTTTHTIIKNPAKCPSYTSSILRLRTIISTTLICSENKIIVSFITTQEKIITYYIIMAEHIAICKVGWKSPDGVPAHG